MTTRLRRALLATLIFTAWAAVPVVAADPPPAATMEGHPALPRAPRHTMTKQGRQGDTARSGALDGYYWVDKFHANREGRNGGGDPYFTDGRLAVGVISIRR